MSNFNANKVVAVFMSSTAPLAGAVGGVVAPVGAAIVQSAPVVLPLVTMAGGAVILTKKAKAQDGGCNGQPGPCGPTDPDPEPETPSVKIVNKPTNTVTGTNINTANGGNGGNSSSSNSLVIGGDEAAAYAPSISNNNFTICGKSFSLSAGVVEFTAGIGYSKTDMECFQEYMSRTEIQNGMNSADIVIRKLTVGALLEANPYYKSGIDNMDTVESLYSRYGTAASGVTPTVTFTPQGCPEKAVWDKKRNVCVLDLNKG